MTIIQKNEAQTWCELNGWTGVFFWEGEFYAFPPGAVESLPLPESVQPKVGSDTVVFIDMTDNKWLLLFLIVLISASLYFRPIVEQHFTSPWLVLGYMDKIALSGICFCARFLAILLGMAVMFNSLETLKRFQVLVLNATYILPIVYGALVVQFCDWMKVIFGLS